MQTIGSVRTKRWDDEKEADDGFRLLVTRYRPRGLTKALETWDAWEPDLGPSKELHARAYEKIGHGISWSSYRSSYLLEMRPRREKVAELARRIAAGETITLLCSSQCDRENRCHRSILKELIESEVRRIVSSASAS